MNKLLLFIFGMSFLTGFAQQTNKPEISKTVLIKFIEESQEEGKLGEDPVLVLDETIILNLDSLKEARKFFGELSVIRKGNEGITEIYGERAIDGVVLIQSLMREPTEQDDHFSDSKVLYLLDDRQISMNDLMQIDPETIESIYVFKSKEEVAKYTDEEFGSVVLITMKNKN